MKKKAILTIILIMTACTAVSALEFKAGYFGETVLHPGASAGIESIINVSETIDWYWGGEIGSYMHIRNHAAVFGSVGTGLRFGTAFGLFLQIEAGAGGMLRTPAGTVYTDDPDAGISEKNLITPAFIIPASVGIGWDFRKTERGISGLYLTTGIFGEYPFNGYILPHITACAGIRFSL